MLLPQAQTAPSCLTASVWLPLPAATMGPAEAAKTLSAALLEKPGLAGAVETIFPSAASWVAVSRPPSSTPGAACGPQPATVAQRARATHANHFRPSCLIHPPLPSRCVSAAVPGQPGGKSGQHLPGGSAKRPTIFQKHYSRVSPTPWESTGNPKADAQKAEKSRPRLKRTPAALARDTSGDFFQVLRGHATHWQAEVAVDSQTRSARHAFSVALAR